MEDKENEIDDKALKTYRMLYLQTITQSYQWLQEQSPYLWLAFQKTIYGLIKIEEYKQEIRKYEEQIIKLDIEIKQATRIVAGEEAVLGWSGKNPLVASAIENLQKVGLSTVPIVTLFSIAGIGAILNPFANQQQPWGVVFLLWSSVAFVLLTSSAIIKLTHRLSKKHWEQTFLCMSIRNWFVLGCFLFGLIEGLGGGSLAANLLDTPRRAIIERGLNPTMKLLDDSEKLKITAIISLFSYLNILFSVSKGIEIRILQSNKIRRDRAAKVLANANDERKDLMSKILKIKKALRDPTVLEDTDVELLNGSITFDIKAEEAQGDIRNLSSGSSMKYPFTNKHPGTYSKDMSISSNNGNEHTRNENQSKSPE